MGIWTHVDSIIKVDCKNTIDDFHQYFGEEIVYLVDSNKYRDNVTLKIDWDQYYIDSQKEHENNNKKWDDYKKNPDKYLPLGSEGSLHLKSRLATKVKNTVYPYRYIVKIYGGLRDHYSVEEVINCIRDGVSKLEQRHDCCLSAEVHVRNYINGIAMYKFEDCGFRDKDYYQIKEPYTGS